MARHTPRTKAAEPEAVLPEVVAPPVADIEAPVIVEAAKVPEPITATVAISPPPLSTCAHTIRRAAFTRGKAPAPVYRCEECGDEKPR